MARLDPTGVSRILSYIKTWVTTALGGKANSSHNHTKSQITDFPTIPSNTSQLTNDSGYITADGAAYPRRVGGATMWFDWNGQDGQPNWLWGSNDGVNMYVYNPANFSVNYANSAGSAGSATTAETVSTSVAADSSKALVYASMANTDQCRIMCGGADNNGYLEIATSDDGNEPIYVRQYNNGTFGSIVRTLTLLDGSGNTQFPGTVSAPTFSGNLNGNCNYANSAGNSDTLDSYHEYSFLRSREATDASGEGTLWAQIGIKNYNNALPDGLNDVYNWGEVVSLAGICCRFDIYCSHISSDGGGLYYRSGWNDDKKAWRCFIDSANIGSQSVNYANSAGSANDPNAVHKSGDETIGGTKTYSSDICSTNSQHLWFRHLDGSNNGGMDGCLFLNYSNNAKNVYFNGTDYYINGGYYNGRAENAQYTYWLRTSSHTDHLLHTEWDGSYFWTYVTAGDGGYRAVRVERSNSSGYADSAGGADHLGDIGSTDRNGASGTGWYSVGFSYSYDEGHNELAINNYWGIRFNCRDSAHVSINGSRINVEDATYLNGYRIYVG